MSKFKLGQNVRLITFKSIRLMVTFIENNKIYCINQENKMQYIIDSSLLEETEIAILEPPIIDSV